VTTEKYERDSTQRINRAEVNG